MLLSHRTRDVAGHFCLVNTFHTSKVHGAAGEGRVKSSRHMMYSIHALLQLKEAYI